MSSSSEIHAAQRPNLVEQHAMKDIIDTFDIQQYAELYRIIQKSGSEYTKNVNGIFVNLKLLSNTTLLEVKKYVDYIKETNTRLKSRDENIKK